jgi:hypothetical protein
MRASVSQTMVKLKSIERREHLSTLDGFRLPVDTDAGIDAVSR